MRKRLEDQAPALRFDCQEDALNYARKLVEDSNHFLASHGTDILERYKNGDAVLEVKVRIINGDHFTPCDYDFIIGVVPKWRREPDNPGRGDGMPKFRCVRSFDSDFKLYEDCVLVGIDYFAEGPQELIPVLVWLERSKQRPEFLRYVLRMPFKFTFEVGIAPTKREVTHFGWRDPACDQNGGVSGVIQNFAQIIDGIPGNLGEISGDVLVTFQFMNSFLGSFRILLNSTSVGIRFFERSKMGFEIADMKLCPREFTVCAKERIVHFRVSSI